MRFSILPILLLGPDVSSSDSSETANESQLGGETNGDESPLTQAGSSSTGGNASGSQTAGNSSSAAVAQGVAARGNIGQVSGQGNTNITTIDTSDPAVTTAALEADYYTSQAADSVANIALNDEQGTATAAIQGNTTVSVAALEAGAIDTANDDSLAEGALQSAADAEADSTTAVEASSDESDTVASNALAAAQNETLAGVTPAQEFQSVEASTPTSGISAGNIATWLTIGVGIITVIYFLKKGKLS
jgi:hypothetical protein